MTQFTEVELTKTNRLSILSRARQILSKKENWTQSTLRAYKLGSDDGYQYCLLGALERAAYDLGLAVEGDRPFKGSGDKSVKSDDFDAYLFGEDISIAEFSRQKFGVEPFRINDINGYEATLKLLDEYIDKVQLQEE